MTHGCLGRPRPGGVEHGRRRAFAEVAPRFRLERALAGPVLRRASKGAPCRRSFTGESAQNLAKSGSRRSYVGKVAPALVDRGAGGLLRWPETEHVPLSGWESTMCQFAPPIRGRIGCERTICALRGGRAAFERGQVGNEATAKRAGGGPPPIRIRIAPHFQVKRGVTGGYGKGRGTRRRKLDWVAGPEVRICSISRQKGLFFDSPIGT